MHSRYGTDLTKRLTVDINQPLPELAQGAALRINLMGNDGNVAGRDIARNSRFGIAPSLALGLGTPTRLNFNYLHLSEYDDPDYGLPWINSAAAGTVSAIARPAPLSQTRENYYGFRQGNYFRANVDVATVRIEHDINSAVTISDQLRYAHYTRQFRITEPQLYTAASANGIGNYRYGGADRTGNTAVFADPYPAIRSPAIRSKPISSISLIRRCASHWLYGPYVAHRHRSVARNLAIRPATRR